MSVRDKGWHEAYRVALLRGFSKRAAELYATAARDYDRKLARLNPEERRRELLPFLFKKG